MGDIFPVRHHSAAITIATAETGDVKKNTKTKYHPAIPTIVAV
jgi:hypothetical protein